MTTQWSSQLAKHWTRPRHLAIALRDAGVYVGGV
ncbi:MAG: hypothetical protein RL385_3309, partial [Pseudomonadota bacterium]